MVGMKKEFTADPLLARRSIYMLTDGQFNGEPPNFAKHLCDLWADQDVRTFAFQLIIIWFGASAEVAEDLIRLEQSLSNLNGLPSGLYVLHFHPPPFSSSCTRTHTHTHRKEKKN
jgi:hypothetical protein